MLSGKNHRRFLPALHSLRGLAALWVLVFHVWFFSGEPHLILRIDLFTKMGWLGVHLFYALSAFLLTGHLLGRNNYSYRAFFTRRFLRIYPAYWAQLLVLLAIGGWLTLSPSQALSYWPEHLLMIFHLPPRYVQPLNGVWWTLPIEFAFYLLLPVLLWLLKRIGPTAFFVLVVAETVIFRYATYQQFGAEIGLMAEQLPGVLSVFGAGMIAAWLIKNQSPVIPKWCLSMVLIAALTWASILLMNVDTYWQGSPLFFFWSSINGIIFATLIVCLFRVSDGALANGVLVWLGEVSYGVYLWHLPVILGLTQFIPVVRTDFYLLLLSSVPLTLLFAWLSLLIIERPAMKIAAKKTDQHP